MVGHPPRRPSRGQGTSPPLTPDAARWLLSEAGRTAVGLAQSLDLGPAARIAAAARVSALAGPERGPLALEQALLRARAVAKHPRGDELWWTGPALEQASSAEVAAWRARRFPGAALDLCCSVGGDLLALPDGSTGVDLDEARLLLAAENARVLGRSVTLACADVTTLRLPPGGTVFVDPARRAGGRRTFDPRDYAPPLEAVLTMRHAVAGLSAKVAPGLPYDALPSDVEVEVVSLRGEVKEMVLWAGALRSGARRSATLLPTGHTLEAAPGPAVPVAAPSGWLLDLDGAVVRAHLVQEAAREVGGRLLDPTIAYLCASEPAPTPWGRWYEVLDVLPFGLKPLRAALRGHDAGPLVVKKRGTAVEPEQLRRALKLTGSREVTVVLTRSAGKQVAIIVNPVGPGAPGPSRPLPPPR